jgi:hypothetical protein
MIIFTLALVGWVVSIVFNVLTIGAFRWISNVLGIIALVSLPIAVVVHLFQKRS